eukprot:4387717-Pleurochrysis_carterae.AAC.1
MKIDRSQYLLTRSINDIIALVNDDVAYSKVHVEDIECSDRGGWAYRAQFHEYDYADSASAFKVCPYMSGYMLAYSKMLINLSMQHLARGATMLYTDTDSITFACTPEVWQEYKQRYVPLQKTLGGMDVENEAEFVRFVSVGPKKYAKVRPDGSYIFKCNGLQPKCCTQIDVLS